MKLEELHDRIYEVYKAFDAVCKAHNIQYWMHGGSAIGAVREHDFIPWDDDMDILILAEDYERLKEAMKDLPEHLHFIEPSDHNPYFYDFILRVQDDRWTIREETKESQAYKNYNNRVGIEIFLLGKIPKNTIRQSLYLLRYNVIYGMGMYYRYSVNYKKYSIRQKIRVFILRCMGFFYCLTSPKRVIKKWKRYIRVCDGIRSYCRMVVNTTPQSYWHPMPDEWFQETIEVPFRDMMVPIEKEYDKILTYTYGDYLKPVDVE